MRKLLVAAVATFSIFSAFATQPAEATTIPSVSFADSLPLGPFSTSQTVIVKASITNASATDTISLCEGVCVGDANTFSLGAMSEYDSLYYDFFFGDGGDTSLGFLDGQIAGPLGPGQTKDFIFSEYVPLPSVEPGLYDFFAQLQVFAATPDRPMLAADTRTTARRLHLLQFSTRFYSDSARRELRLKS